MSRSFTALAVLISAAMGSSPGRAEEPPRPVDHVDLGRYAGLWYEIAKIPNKFEKQCAYGTTATYTLRDDGKITVTNRCFEEDGKVDEIAGVARVEDRASNARLGVSFFSLLGWRPVWAPYWILGLGADYEYAVVGSPSRTFLWILSRTPEMDESTYEAILQRLPEKGFDPGGLGPSSQTSAND